MNFVRKIANSELLANVIDIPKELRNKKVEVIILPYEDINHLAANKKKNLRGALAKYKNKNLIEKENNAWAHAVVEKYENS